MSETNAPSWARVEGTLMTTARAVRRAYDRCLATADVNFTEASILAHLADAGPYTQVELARLLGTGRAQIGLHIDSLVRKGVVERRADPTDRRVWKIHMTPKGADVWQSTVEIDRHVRERLRANTTPAQRHQLDEVLRQIGENAGAL